MDAPSKPPPDLNTNLDVSLTRGEFAYYNWVLALERPVLPFFIYTFTFLTLISVLGVWPDGRLFAFAVLVPMLGYLLFVWMSTRSLWPRIPDTFKRRRYKFGPDSYQVGGKKLSYAELERVLESRRALYLLHGDGRADILPKRLMKDEKAFADFLKGKVEKWKGSSFL